MTDLQAVDHQVTILPAIIEEKVNDTSKVVKENLVVIENPEVVGEGATDPKLQYTQLKLAQLRQDVDEHNRLHPGDQVDFHQVLGQLAERSILGTSSDPTQVTSNLEQLLPEQVAEVEKPYSAQISRASPGYFEFLVDGSGSMGSKIGELERVLNKTITTIVKQKCVRRIGTKRFVRRYFELSGLVYSGQSVSPLFAGEGVKDGVVGIDKLTAHPKRIGPDGPVFVEGIKPTGRTPMVQALRQTLERVKERVRQRPFAFPPIIINLSDGAATDGDPVPVAEEIMNIETRNGNALMFNCHLTGNPSDEPILFPQSVDELPQEGEYAKYARQMFEMSSDLPPSFLEMAKDMGLVPEGAASAKAMAFNCDIDRLAKFLVIGTRGSLVNVEQ